MIQTGFNQRMHVPRGRRTDRRTDSSLRAGCCGSVTVEMGEKAMRAGSVIKPTKTHKPTMTDRILTFCASGRFGVREAIAAVTAPKEKTKKQSPQAPDTQQTG
jgi:hypothetical protein